MTRAQGDPSPPDQSVSLDHFVGMYEAKTDPWDNATKWSDQRKYAVTMASLLRPRYRLDLIRVQAPRNWPLLARKAFKALAQPLAAAAKPG